LSSWPTESSPLKAYADEAVVTLDNLIDDKVRLRGKLSCDKHKGESKRGQRRKYSVKVAVREQGADLYW